MVSSPQDFWMRHKNKKYFLKKAEEISERGIWSIHSQKAYRLPKKVHGCAKKNSIPRWIIENNLLVFAI